MRSWIHLSKLQQWLWRQNLLMQIIKIFLPFLRKKWLIIFSLQATHYEWFLESETDGRPRKIAARKIRLKKSDRELNYVPLDERDLGRLLCFSKNQLGRQIKPCVFNVVLAGKPYFASKILKRKQSIHYFFTERNVI